MNGQIMLDYNRIQDAVQALQRTAKEVNRINSHIPSEIERISGMTVEKEIDRLRRCSNEITDLGETLELLSVTLKKIADVYESSETRAANILSASMSGAAASMYEISNTSGFSTAVTSETIRSRSQGIQVILRGFFSGKSLKNEDWLEDLVCRWRGEI